MPSAWQISSSEPKDWRTTEGIQNLHLVHGISKPKADPKSALVRIKAAALNARDMMVISHDPIYPVETLPDLVPCADGAGIVEEVGPGSKWKLGDRVLLIATGWADGDVPTLIESAGLGAGAIQGTLREYAVVVSTNQARLLALLYCS
jgi:NADPH:quinone reductase-like Zn-dependent oxidoreductase